MTDFQAFYTDSDLCLYVQHSIMRLCVWLSNTWRTISRLNANGVFIVWRKQKFRVRFIFSEKVIMSCHTYQYAALLAGIFSVIFLVSNPAEARSVNLPSPQCHPSIINSMPPKIRKICDALSTIWEFSDAMESYLDEKGIFFYILLTFLLLSLEILVYYIRILLFYDDQKSLVCFNHYNNWAWI